MPLAIGSILEGEVTGITKFGAFIQLETGETGLVHISEIGRTYVKDIAEYLKVKDKVKVKVLKIDENGRINLSIKQAIEETEKENKKMGAKRKLGAPEQIDFSVPSDEMSFEDRMNRFKKDSEERLSDLKRNIESKRGSGGYKKGYY